MVTVQPSDQALPPAARAFLSDYGLPRVVVFESRSPFEISFAPLEKPLVPYRSLIRWGGAYNVALAQAWGRQMVVGAEEFCNGHASYCVHHDTGAVARLDCELPDPETFVNADVERFGRSLLAARQWSDRPRGQGRPAARPDYDDLARALRSIDGQAFERPDHHWPSLIDWLLDEDPIELEVTSDPARSRPRF